MAAQTDRFDARLDLVPQNPGVYLMKDAAGSVIYVGKALNLQNRLRSYFTANPQGTPKVLAMISHIADFSYLICQNEVEALILECNLIKEYQPHYNILLRDDRAYPYIRITMNELYPRVLKAYRIGPDRKAGARYYGPYLNGDLYRALNALRETFPMKTCRREFPRDIGKERPCLNYHIGRCIGPCRGDVSADDYRKVMADICLFLEGKYDGILQQMRRRMQAAAEDLRFEEAGILRDRLASLERLMARQQVVSGREQDKDAIGIASNEVEHAILKLEVRGGRLIGSGAFFFPEDGSPPEAVLAAFCEQHYPDVALVPPTLLLPIPIESQNELSEFLTTLRGTKVTLRVPQRGEDHQLLNMASTNARESLRRQTLAGRGANDLSEALRTLASELAITGQLSRIEAYDISHIQGVDQAASLVVFEEGRPRRHLYRRFKVDDIAGADDPAALVSVLSRRLAHLGDHSLGARPDLLLLDGGRLQVQAVSGLLEFLEIDIPVAGIVKDERHRTRGLVRQDGSIVELRRPGTGKSGKAGKTAWGSRVAGRIGKGASAMDAQLALRGADRGADSRQTADEAAEAENEAQALFAETGGIAPENLSLLRLLTAIQDEAHRFAGQYREKRSFKRQTRYKLEDIPGVGPARRRALLSHFSSIKAISEAAEREIAAVPDIGPVLAGVIFRHFHPDASAGSAEVPAETAADAAQTTADAVDAADALLEAPGSGESAGQQASLFEEYEEAGEEAVWLVAESGPDADDGEVR